MLRYLLFLTCAAASPQLLAHASEPELGDAIRLAPSEIEALTVEVPSGRAPRGVQNTSGFSIDLQDRNSVVAAYQRYYLDSETYKTNHAWNGNIGSCSPGTVSGVFLDDTLRRINYFRAQAGLPADIYFSSNKNIKSQQAALMMSRNSTLSHTPPSSWPCYTAGGAEAAGASNLSLGTNSFGPGSVNGQMTDSGDNNAVAGHRRWLLYSRASEMGAGSIPTNTQGYFAASCIWVIGDFKPAPTAQAVAWPNQGYVPWQIVPNQSESDPRWSFSYPGANFAGATVTMSRGGISISVIKEVVTNGIADNTIVWRPSGIPNAAPATDTTYTVTIRGVGNAPQSTYTYDVTLIDPFELGTEISVTGPASPTVGQSSPYSFNQISGADQYEASISGVASGVWLEGAESGGSMSDGTSSDYSYRTTALAATGSYAFHLTIPSFAEAEQTISVGREVVPSSSSRFEFKNRFRFMTAQTQLHAEISADGGAGWESIWSRSPSSSIQSSSNWESSWDSASIPIPAEYQGRTVQVRLRFAPASTGSTVSLGTSDGHGAFVDDISVTNSQELVNSTPTTLASSSNGFNFTPPSAALYALRVRAKLGTHWFKYGPPLLVTAQTGTPTPSISSLSPSSGSVGTSVLINGSNFNITPSQNTISFGGVQAQVISATATRLDTIVPNGVTGTVAVTVTVGGRTTNPVNFLVTQPVDETIYATGFANFAGGLNTINATDGWMASPVGDGSSGTLTHSGFPTLGQSAFVGFNPPSNDFVGIWRPLNRNPLGEGKPVVEFSVDLAIIDSTNDIWDLFSVRFYNGASELLATIVFNNQNLSIHTWDGNGFTDTGKRFENGVLFTLSGSINFATNTWSAQMVSSSPGSVHTPLFSNLPFHSGDRAKDLGLMLFAWQLEDLTGQVAGDNYMLVDNFSINYVSVSAARPRILHTWMSAAGTTFNMTWQATAGHSYQVRHSGDLKSWSSSLPNSFFTTDSSQTQHTFSHANVGGSKFYQVTTTPP
jgi:hypothetical protein